MSAPLQTGDAVECIATYLGNEVSPVPVKGATYRVLAITDGVDVGGTMRTGIQVFPEDEANLSCWNPERFRKIGPASDTFTAEIRAMRPIREREPA